METVNVIKVILTESKRDLGTNTDPVRLVTQYWSMDGKLIVEFDPINEDEIKGIDCLD